ncbi:MAG: class III extradiol ring-cleavage dioxygenase [Arhodomonas sp.]|nr:class III extradiol ring-cleavage dioxygenase [Arhodomonas sp.]
MHPAVPTHFIPHGGGPCFFMEWDPPDAWDRMEAWLRGLLEQLPRRPSAVVVVSAHREASAFTVNAQAAPPLLFDYYGFPAHTYELTWPAAGEPELAERVRELLADGGLPEAVERERGLDHGVFIPFKLIDPEADIPVVELSLRAGLDPAEHIAAGRALQALREEGVWLVGSGMSFHNMRRFHWDNSGLDADSVGFDEWLGDAVTAPAAERERRLVAWADAPGGRASHPREEHLLPLHVVAGAGGEDAGAVVFQDRVLGSAQSAFRFG